MKTITITWPLQSRLLNSTFLISWMSISNFQGALGTICVEKIMKHLVLRILQNNGFYSSFGEYDSSNWGSLFFLSYNSVWSFSRPIWFLLSLNLAAFLLFKTLWACTVVTLTLLRQSWKQNMIDGCFSDPLSQCLSCQQT